MKTAKVLLSALIIAALIPGLALAVEVVDAAVCEGVQEREPVNPGAAFPADIGTVYCWSKIKDGDGAVVKHVYYYEGEEMASVELAINSSLWRTHSSKRIPPSSTGKWRVDIVDAEGVVLRSIDFSIGEVVEPEPAPQEESSAEEQQQ
ncbi:MAG: DUF2914 domain-containing protein [Candidatus Abyssobacteria bacterium SURF_17]|jgi:hypothetical protein|uniref:DUF2914 domain-containing protein n=1 Tax=Candidatus Abyssobacteria bacterium SURF_17 TaxID=2093361 RepID=A0A419ETN9_9BACT|nr:MAG: DUF2914 domain-containing protein [Candidatus Abyssubacteria bacterium SURF_17]